MQMMYYPEVVQVLPTPDYVVYVYFSDGKITAFDVKPFLDRGVFRVLRDRDIYMNRCKIMNDTLAWDVAGNDDPRACIDIDPDVLYSGEAVDDPLEGL